ncbi:MAG: nucleotide exchange factor GrpE [Chitinophagales bacterium]|nr:nucleotide exchange factor GrpE [Bacteroidota bacterium]MCB9043963.1 nucleotide exchange factor GrpE [Chitinophagales bacterium]
MDKEKNNPNMENELSEEQLIENENSVTTEEIINKTDDVAEKLRQEVQEAKDKYLRLFSDFENMKRRTARERLELTQTASQDVIKELLPVIDDFERAFGAEGIDASKEEGFGLIYHKLWRTLENRGLSKMDAKGQAFNPEFHEAITEISAPSEEMIGKVIDVIENGYLLNNKIIRYAKVVVGK